MGNKPFPKTDRAGGFVPLASGRNAEGALPVRTDAEVYGALLQAGARLAKGLIIENEKMVAIHRTDRL